jgi:hypothetical protein
VPGRGPSPKAPEQRRRRNAPSGGEWIDLPPVPKPAKDKPLPALPKRPAHLGPWSARTRAAWAAWREDPATTQYTSGDVAAAIELAWLFEDCVRSPTSRLASEIRLRTDGLGLSAKGKRDLRWRASAPRHVAEIPDEVAVARARRQRVMAADPRSV